MALTNPTTCGMYRLHQVDPLSAKHDCGTLRHFVNIVLFPSTSRHTEMRKQVTLGVVCLILRLILWSLFVISICACNFIALRVYDAKLDKTKTHAKILLTS